MVSIRVASVPTIAGADVLQFTYGNFTSVETFTVSSAVNLSSATSQSPNLLSGLRMKFYNDPTQSIYALAGSSAPSGSPCFAMSSPSNLDFTQRSTALAPVPQQVTLKDISLLLSLGQLYFLSEQMIRRDCKSPPTLSMNA
jgi:hypothetical protein